MRTLQTRVPAVVAAVLVVGTLMVRRMRHVVVAGGSMRPTLEPGDRLLVLQIGGAPRPGALALTTDPRAPERELIKRVHSVRGGRVDVRGDAAAASTDSMQFGTLPVGRVERVLAFRYHPPGRTGRLSSRRARARAGRRRCRPTDPR